MLRLIQDLLDVLTAAQRRRLLALQLLVAIRTLAEIAGVAAIGPFMLLVSNLKQLDGNGRLARLYRWSGIESGTDFLIVLGASALLALLVSSLLSIYTTRSLLGYSKEVGSELSIRLFRYYMNQPWIYHASTNSSILTRRIAVEASRVTKSILTPMMQANASLMLASMLLLALCFVDIVVTLCGAALFTSAYLITYWAVRVRINRNSKLISRLSSRHFKMMAEAFGGVRDMILRGAQEETVERFRKTSIELSEHHGSNATLAQTPRYIIEFAAVAAMVMFVFYLVRLHEGDISLILPTAAVYGFAVFKLLPAFQGMYSNLATMKGAQANLDGLKEDLVAGLPYDSDRSAQNSHRANPIPLKSTLRLSHISFTYPTRDAPAIAGLDMSVDAGTLVGLVGASGAGKSTLVDIVLGLLRPDAGDVVVDDHVIGGGDFQRWRNSVAYVPQSVYLIDGTVEENIALELSGGSIDGDRVDAAIRTARLDELVRSLPRGKATRVGERGIQLSGGQRQRIGIARALYTPASLLILDEATNALDVLTEKAILDDLLQGDRIRTILMIAHRLNTIRTCDVIHFLSGGRIVDHGTFDELVERNAEFRQMAWLS